MKALNPLDPEGELIDVRIAQGQLYTIRCSNPECGFENGGRIVGEGLPAIGDMYEDNDLKCVICEHPAEWVLVG